jgi:hypothetical protein
MMAVTPYATDGTIDRERLGGLARDAVVGGFGAFVAAGGAGELGELAAEEVVELVAASSRELDPSRRLVSGIVAREDAPATPDRLAGAGADDLLCLPDPSTAAAPTHAGLKRLRTVGSTADRRCRRGDTSRETMLVKRHGQVFWSYEGQWAVRSADLKPVVSAREGMVPPVVVDGALYDGSTDQETTDAAELFPSELPQLRADLADFPRVHASWAQGTDRLADHDSSRHRVDTPLPSEIEGAGSAA